MVETLVWCFIGWLLGSFVLRVITRVNEDDDTTEQSTPDRPLSMTIQMEQFKGYWYGWFNNDDGSEVFISQGSTYDEAINNCKLRVMEKNPDLPLKFNFEMKNANTAVQN